MGIESGLRASGVWENVKVYNAQRSGNWLTSWVNGTGGNYTAAINFTEDLWASDDSSGLQQMIQQLESKGHTVHVVGAFWFQGEGDTGAVSHQIEYAPRLTWMIETLRSYYGDFELVITQIDWNHDLPDNLAASGRTPEDVDAIRAAQIVAAQNLGAQISDSRGRNREDLWHVTDWSDPRGLYGVATDFGADQALLMINRLRCVVDIDENGILDFFDISNFLAAFNAGCP